MRILQRLAAAHAVIAERWRAAAEADDQAAASTGSGHASVQAEQPAGASAAEASASVASSINCAPQHRLEGKGVSGNAEQALATHEEALRNARRILERAEKILSSMEAADELLHLQAAIRSLAVQSSTSQMGWASRSRV